MPLDGHAYLVSQGWTGKGTGLRQGAIARPLVIPQKKTLAGLGKDRDEAFPFWDHLFTAAASSIKVKIHNDSSDESDSDEGPDLNQDNKDMKISNTFNRTSTGILSNKRPTTGTPASTDTSTPSNESSSLTLSSGPKLSLLAIAKRQAARRRLYAGFFRGPLLGPDGPAEVIVSEEFVENTSSSSNNNGVAGGVEDDEQKKKEKRRKADDMEPKDDTAILSARRNIEEKVKKRKKREEKSREVVNHSEESVVMKKRKKSKHESDAERQEGDDAKAELKKEKKKKKRHVKDTPIEERRDDVVADLKRKKKNKDKDENRQRSGSHNTKLMKEESNLRDDDEGGVIASTDELKAKLERKLQRRRLKEEKRKVKNLEES